MIRFSCCVAALLEIRDFDATALVVVHQLTVRSHGLVSSFALVLLRFRFVKLKRSEKQ